MSGDAFTFDDVYYTLVFMVALWIAGKAVVRVGMPALVGEIITGMILGPELLNFAPKPDALMMFGEIGLVMLVLEAGLDVDLETLKIIGYRGICVALFGSMVPLGIGMRVCDVCTSVCVNACMLVCFPHLAKLSRSSHLPTHEYHPHITVFIYSRTFKYTYTRT